MSRDRDAKTVEWASGTNVFVGVWLFATPFVLDFAGNDLAAGNAGIVGLLVAMLAASRVMAGFVRTWLSWTNVALGVWIVVSPWVLGTADVAAIRWSHLITGLVIAVLAATSAMAKPDVREPRAR